MTSTTKTDVENTWRNPTMEAFCICLFLPSLALGFVGPVWKVSRNPPHFSSNSQQQQHQRHPTSMLRSDVTSTGRVGEWKGEEFFAYNRSYNSELVEEWIDDDKFPNGRTCPNASTTVVYDFSHPPPPLEPPPPFAVITATDTSSPSSPSSVSATTFSVMKAMLGSGVLALPSGLAAVTDYKNTIWSANLIFVGLGFLSAYTFALYGRLCHVTNAQSLGDIWKSVHDTEDSTPISLAGFSFCYGGCLIFLLIIGDTLSSIVRAFLSQQSNPVLSAGWMGCRQTAILSVMVTLLWPLCNLKSLAALAPFSIVGVFASVVSSIFVVWRCPLLFPASPYSPLTPGNFLGSLPAHHVPRFGSYCKIFSAAPLVLMGMAGMALMAHFSAPDFYQSLAGGSSEEGGRPRTASASDLPLKKYLKTTALSFTTVGLINALTMTCGFLTFGGNSAGMILNNYATTDFGASLSRLLVAVSMIGGFPLLFNALRSSVDDLLVVKKQKNVAVKETFPISKSQSMSLPPLSNRSQETLLKLGLLVSLLCCSMVVQNVGLVVGLVGTVSGSAIIYSFPALMFLRLLRHGSGGSGSSSSSSSSVRRESSRKIVVRHGERVLCRGLVAFGVVSAMLGGATTILNALRT